MAVNVEVISAEQKSKTSKAGKTYDCFEIVYKVAETEEQKLINLFDSDFKFNSELAAAKELKAGDKKTFKFQKDDKGYFKLCSIHELGEAPLTAAPYKSAAQHGGGNSSYADNQIGMKVGLAIKVASEISAAGASVAALEVTARKVLVLSDKLAKEYKEGKLAVVDDVCPFSESDAKNA